MRRRVNADGFRPVLRRHLTVDHARRIRRHESEKVAALAAAGARAAEDLAREIEARGAGHLRRRADPDDAEAAARDDENLFDGAAVAVVVERRRRTEVERE